MPVKFRLRKRSVTLFTVGLISVGMVLIVATATLFENLRDRQQSIRTGVREDAMWAVFQTHREASRLIETILLAQTSPTPETLANVSLNFDLVYSRVSLLETGFFSELFNDTVPLYDSAKALQRDIYKMADEIDALLETPDGLTAALGNLLGDARDIQSRSNDLVINTNSALNRARSTDRAATAQDYSRLAKMVATMAAVFLGTIGFQFYQLRLISQTQRQLRKLSARSVDSAKVAEAASKSKSLFLATMSHEIRTPLNGIIGAVDLLNQTGLNEEQARRVLTIRRSGHVLLDVINDILDFSNLDANGVTFQNGPVSMPEMADLLTDIFRHRLDDAGLDFDISVPPMIVSTDDVRMRQVLLNLIGNAIKFTPSGKVTVTAYLKADEVLRVEVKDSGIGIPKEDQSKLFQDFSQIEASASRRFGGSGLGLAISKRIVGGLGGTIGVESAMGHGSTFWFELPVKVIGPAEPDEAAGQPNPKKRDPKFSSRVLLVEDNRINQEVAKALFESFGVTVTTAEDGQVALDCIRANTFDLVIMDLQMPVMDGIAATKALRALGHTMPVVGLTANAFAEDRRLCLDAGMDEFVAKPVTREKIAAVLTSFATASAEPPEAVEADVVEAEAPEPELLDFAQLHPVLADVGVPLFLDLLEQLSNDGQDLLAQAGDTDTGRAADEIDPQLHALKGAAATMGLKGVAAEAQRLRTTDIIMPADITALVALINSSIDAARLDVGSA